MSAKFDWYAATIDQHSEKVASELLDAVPHDNGQFAPARPMFGYSASEILKDAKGNRLTLMWGGDKGFDTTHVVATGDDALIVVPALRALYPDHRVTRVDSALDFNDQESLYVLFHELAKFVGGQHSVRVSELRPIGDDERGSTTYVGADKSAVRARIYEKGKQPGFIEHGMPLWVRAEAQWRPAKEEKLAASRLSADDVWGVSKWLGDLATLIGARSEPQDIRVHRKPVFERTNAALLRQYGQHLIDYAQQLGSWTCLGLQLEHDLRAGRT